ncbi:PorT family protein [bacterium SCSIO 12643]|nr:PorT family protein [bacterium SCSIO 12643]
MKYFTITLTCVLMSIFAQAQNHKLQFGVVGGGDIQRFSTYSFERVTPDHMLGWSAGVSMQHNMMKRFSIHYKLMFNKSKINYTIYKQYYMPDRVVPKEKTYIEKSILAPVLAKWTFGQKKFHWSVDVGMLLKLGLQYSYYDRLDDMRSSDVTIKNYVWFGNAITSGVGVSYDLTDKYTISTEARIAQYYWYDFDFDQYELNGQWLISLKYGFGKE